MEENFQNLFLTPEPCQIGNTKKMEKILKKSQFLGFQSIDNKWFNWSHQPISQNFGTCEGL